MAKYMTEYIDKEKAIYLVEKAVSKADAMMALLRMDPADVRPVRRGRWIIRTRHEHYPSGRAYKEIVCPFCGKVDHNGDGNFCGYCGVDMGKDGEQHDTY